MEGPRIILTVILVFYTVRLHNTSEWHGNLDYNELSLLSDNQNFSSAMVRPGQLLHNKEYHWQLISFKFV